MNVINHLGDEVMKVFRVCGWAQIRHRPRAHASNIVSDSGIAYSNVTYSSVTYSIVTNLLMSRPLYGRRRELRALEQAWTSGKPELLIAAGRRRSGKSYLLTHVLAERRGFYYQATKGTSREQLARVSGAVGVQFPDSRVDLAGGFRDWESFFEFIVVEAAGQPFLLILDEVPYLLDAIRGFGSVLQAVWDHRLADSQIKLVLSGSYISAMHRLTAADQPLHGRRTVSLPFLPFSYRDAASFMAQYPPRDQLIGYAAFGGLPGQLSLIDPTLSIVKNIETHLIDPVGRLSDEGERLLDAFLREAGVHYAIVRAVASGEHKWSKITSRVGKDSASLSRPLDWLLDMDILERVIPATDTPPGNPKKAKYRVADPYLSFWHRFVAPLRATGANEIREPAELWEQMIAPRLNEHMGPVFDAACRTFVAAGEHHRLPFRPVRVGEWWSNDSTNEVDVVALGPDGEVLIGECKWGSVSRGDLATLSERRDMVVKELRGVTRVHLALFSGAPMIDPVVAQQIASGDVLHFPIDDLYA